MHQCLGHAGSYPQSVLVGDLAYVLLSEIIERLTDVDELPLSSGISLTVVPRTGSMRLTVV
jgi:hypothetical protein